MTVHGPAALSALLGALAARLAGAAAVEPDAVAAAGVARFAALVRALAPAGAAARPRPPAAGLPVCRFWAPALQHAARGPAAPLAAALAPLGPGLAWTQNPNYRRRPPSPTFLDHYGYAVLAGPADGPLGLVVEPRLALGLLLLGPRTEYPLHAHPAREVYCPLAAAEWWRGAGPWRPEAPGAVIYHAPGVPHATRTGETPLLAVYVWEGELATHARFMGAGEEAD